jgi:BirA family biotin operon repressor/biotin-[acetyl-CoA-carboxylase] ligase
MRSQTNDKGQKDLVGPPPARKDSLRPNILRKRLDKSIFGRDIIFHETLDSTNSLTKELSARDAPEGTLVLCEEQTAGRGRVGRRWLSPKHANLLFSVLLRPKMPPGEVFSLTMILALAAIDAIKGVCSLKVMIKWPNDLYVGGKKLGGILTEFSAWKNHVEYVVLGLGLNVNWRPGESEGLVYPATSIMAETGKKVSREDLLVQTLENLEAYYRKISSGGVKDFHERWNEESVLRDKRVEIRAAGERICGKARGIDALGALIIVDDDGQEMKIVNGEVSVREMSF